MPGTSGYQAGSDSNASLISYNPENVWGTPALARFAALRYISETLSFNKTRARPGEVPTNREALASTTMQHAVGGSINFALNYGGYSGLFCSALGNASFNSSADSSTAISIANLTGSTAALASSTTDRYATVSVGDWIRISHMVNAGNNDFARVTVKVDNQHLIILKVNTAAPFVTETAPAAARTVTNALRNSTDFLSFGLQQQFASNLYLRYPGAIVTGMTISGGVGQFITGSFDIMAQQEINATAEWGAGGVPTAAPTSSVVDSAAGFRYALLNEVPIGSVLQKFSLNVQNTGAAGRFGMGSATMQGVTQGELEVTGSFDVYFKNFVLYQRFINEQSGALEFIVTDTAGNATIFTVMNANIFGQITAGGPNMPVVASFKIEGNPTPTGGTFQIDLMANV